MSSDRVRVVVDSTADIPPALAATLGITVVPLTVQFGDESFRDGVDLTPDAFMARLTSGGVRPTTAQPSPAEFEATYRALAAEGASVVSIDISSNLSGTFNSARLAAEAVAAEGARVDVIDSRTGSMAHGLIAIEAAHVAAGGADHAAVLAAVQAALGRVHLIFMVDTLEYLQKGGRIGRARALIGSLLNIKPLLTVTDGVVTPVEQARTRSRAVGRVVERARAVADGETMRLAVLHAVDPAGAEALLEQLSAFVPRDRMLIAEVGPVVVTYVGPGCVGFAALTAR